MVVTRKLVRLEKRSDLIAFDSLLQANDNVLEELYAPSIGVGLGHIVKRSLVDR